MKIVYNDGGTLECGKIEIDSDVLIADEYYFVNINDVKEITED